MTKAHYLLPYKYHFILNINSVHNFLSILFTKYSRCVLFFKKWILKKYTCLQLSHKKVSNFSNIQQKRAKGLVWRKVHTLHYQFHSIITLSTGGEGGVGGQKVFCLCMLFRKKVVSSTSKWPP